MSYPHLREILRLMIEVDHGAKLKEEPRWPEDAPALEAVAARLNRSMKERLAMGEERDILRLVNRMKLHRLNEFLTDVFDGPLSCAFWEWPEL